MSVNNLRLKQQALFIIQGSASFGGTEHIVSGEILPSTTYGNLLQTLQGGSGGASSSVKDFQVTGNLDALPAAGVGGGGAIEIGAIGSVQIDADITARGGAKLLLSNPVDGLFYDTSGSVGGGSGGGIRVHGAQVDVNAVLSADFSITPGAGNELGGGGRVLVLNRTSDLPLFVLGREDVASTSYFDNLSAAGAGTQGIFTVSPIQAWCLWEKSCESRRRRWSLRSIYHSVQAVLFWYPLRWRSF